MAAVFASLADKSSFLTVGLMSGTSMDGVDAALVGMDADENAPTVFVRDFVTTPYPDELRSKLSDVAAGYEVSAAEIATLHTSVAVAFAGAFFELCRRGGVDPATIDFIGSHGQTVAHAPPSADPSDTVVGTLQLGAPSMIAALTGVTTVGDFRSGDIALGGQGAPLAPLADWLLRRNAQRDRVILNLGGIANLTWLPAGCSRGEVVAFDTGPGNMVCDVLYRVLYPSAALYDADGARAAEGRVDADVLAKALGHPYFALGPPKSAGHREFGPAFAWHLHSLCEAKGLGRADTLATAAALTAAAVAVAVERFVPGRPDEHDVFVTGGGVHNESIMDELRARLGGTEVRPIDELGIPADAKEAVDFALLARETLMGRPGSLSQVTGAGRDSLLGVIAPGGGA